MQLRLSEPLLSRLGWLDGLSGDLAGVRVSVNGGAPVALAAAAGLVGPRFEGELLARGASGRSAVAALDLPEGGATVRVVRGGAPQTAALAAAVAAESAKAKAARANATAAAPPPFPPPSWPARVVAVDTWTQGQWVGRFGAQGYALAAFSNSSAAGPDVMKLPAWVASVKQIRSSNTWLQPDPNSDARALQDPSGHGRAIGCWYASMTDFVDVWMDAAAEAAGLWWQLAVYLVDYDAGVPSHEGLPARKATVALLNMHSLEPAAPVQYLDTFVGGAWVVFEL